VRSFFMVRSLKLEMESPGPKLKQNGYFSDCMLTSLKKTTSFSL
jgi:hypothetical protein